MLWFQALKNAIDEQVEIWMLRHLEEIGCSMIVGVDERK
jgi:hypothetical protein